MLMTVNENDHVSDIKVFAKRFYGRRGVHISQFYVEAGDEPAAGLFH